MPNAQEIWNDIEGQEGKYMISNQGRVKSLKRSWFTGFATITTQERLLTPRKSTGGYSRVQFIINGKNKDFDIHRLVAKAFLKNTENKPYVNHKNGIKHDNRVENLEWSTPSENCRHALATNLNTHYGEGCRFSKLKESDIYQILSLRKQGKLLREIESEMNMGKGTASLICTGKRWRHIYEKVNQKNCQL